MFVDDRGVSTESERLSRGFGEIKFENSKKSEAFPLKL